jgi:hypothetical protein
MHAHIQQQLQSDRKNGQNLDAVTQELVQAAKQLARAQPMQVRSVQCSAM